MKSDRLPGAEAGAARPETSHPAARSRPAGYWRELWRRYRRSPLGLLALAAISILAAVAIGAPCICGTRPIACRYKGEWYFPALYYWNSRWENPVFFRDGFRIDHYPRALAEKDPGSIAIWPLFYSDPDVRIEDGEWRGAPGDPYGSRPTLRNPLGTDPLGRDVLARMVHGTTIAFIAGVVSMAIAGLIGLVLGALAGYLGGWVDFLVSRLIEVFLSIPSLILVLAVVAIIERPTVWHIMAAIGFVRWVSIARYVRAEFIRLKGTQFILAARAAGVPAPRLMLRHMLPNALAPVIVALTFGMAGAILIEIGLSFLGIGTPPGTPSWGRVLRDGYESRLHLWWLVLFPSLGTFLAVLSYNLAGDAFQEASDPRRRP